MHRIEKNLSSLASCYALLAWLAALFLVYVRVAFFPNPPDLSELIFRPASGQAPRWHQWLDLLREAAYAFRQRMHTTWLFFGVFAAVWLACLLWMQIERSRRGLGFHRRDAVWIAWMSLAVFSAAVFYGLGTNGIFPQRLPQLVTASDVVALALVLAFPVIAWSHVRHRQEEEIEEDSAESGLHRRNSGFLGLDDDEANARLAETLSLREVRPEVRPVDLLPAVQILQERPGEHMRVTADPRLESPESPASPKPVPQLTPVQLTQDMPVEPRPPLVATPIPHFAGGPPSKGIDQFRRHLSTMNSSWQNIETIRAEINDWFERRRQQAIAHLDAHPGMRGSSLAHNLFNDFPNDKLSAVDAEWAKIRTAALEISRWFGDVPAPDRNH